MRVQNSEERGQQSETGYWSLSQKNFFKKERKKREKRSGEDSTPIGSQDAKQKTKSEVCWHELYRACGSKEKSPGMLKDWLQRRKAHSRSNSLMS